MCVQNTELQQQADSGDAQAQFALGFYYSPTATNEGWEFKDKLYQDYLKVKGNQDYYYLLDSIGETLNSIVMPSIDSKIFTALEAAENNKETNDETAFMWFEKAAEQGIVEAQYAVARCYFEGKGTGQNDDLAFKWAEKASHQGFGEAFGLLGDLYREGRGVEQDDKRSLESYEKAVNAGVIGAKSKLTNMRLLCKDITNPDKAKEIIEKRIDKIDQQFSVRINDLKDCFWPRSREDDDELNSIDKKIVLVEEVFNYLIMLSKAAVSSDLLTEESKKQLETMTQKLSETDKNLQEANNRMQKLVEQFTHTLGNVIFPDTIYQVAERLKNNPECRKDVLLLHEAYHSEIIIKLQGELLRQRYTNTNPEKFRQFIRSCRRTPNSAENTKSIEDILDYAASRVTARFLNQHYAGLNSIRDKMLSKKNLSLDALKQKFEDDILLNKSLRPIAWINQNLRPVQMTELSLLWQKVCILSESHAEALLFGYFSEILFNAFKYADHDKDEFLTLVFGEKTINDKTYLACSWLNPVKDKSPAMLGTGKGLDAIQEDLKQLNDTENPEESLLISQQKNQFQVTLFFVKDLLVNDLPSLKIKRKANVE